tara:strand:+ start:1734 stop:2552 length:819 start_codon:yes stop_codon:yes gene_type:complete
MDIEQIDDRVCIERREQIAYVRLTRSDKHNGMDFQMLHAVNKASESLKSDRNCRAVILSGEGPSFCAGLDVQSVMKTPAKAALGYAKLWQPMRNDFQRWSMSWRELGVPVIAAVHGNCFGAGLQLALGADIRFCTPEARLSVMEAKWGLVPDMGGPTLLRELVGIDLAKELCFTGRVISGEQAGEMGLVSHVDADPLAAAERLCTEIIMRSPDAVGASKFLLQESWDAEESESLGAERRWQRRVMGRSNQRISVANNQKSGGSAQPFKPRSV